MRGRGKLTNLADVTCSSFSEGQQAYLARVGAEGVDNVTVSRHSVAEGVTKALGQRTGKARLNLAESTFGGMDAFEAETLRQARGAVVVGDMEARPPGLQGAGWIGKEWVRIPVEARTK